VRVSEAHPPLQGFANQSILLPSRYQRLQHCIPNPVPENPQPVRWIRREAIHPFIAISYKWLNHADNI
jgi:hypothetical protein